MASSSSIPNMASSSSSSSISGSNPPKYDVFLSFRGKDTRKSFRSHLDGALFQSGIKTFYDDSDLQTGDEISSSLTNAIRSSSLSIIIFSQNYASSSWCLNELLEILECRKTGGQIILPIFYHVSPSDVRHQNRNYRAAFAKHEERFTEDKVRKWRDALEQVTELSGSELMPDDKQLETEFIEKIVKDVLAKLNRISSGDHLHPGLVGIRSRVETVESLLCLDSQDFCKVGIWGMGGIGKTTIARAVYNRIANQFKAFCFLENVRNDPKIGLNQLQEKLLSGIRQKGNHYPNDFTISRLRSMKILIVIDNIDDSIHLIDLVGDRSWFGPGSKIIVTSKDRQVLINGVDEFRLYEVEGLNDVDALQLFSLNAFKQSYSPKDHMELSSKFVHYAKCNPLALKVLGCSLFEKSMEVWESSLDNLKKSPNLDILDVLSVSYDRLNYPGKEIFLFIACFFKGEERDRVTTILNGCGFSALAVIDGLVDKCLVTITYGNRLWMHDLIQEMGRHVVFQESKKKPGERSRLWDPQEICDLFKKNTGTEAIESISLDLSQISEQYIRPDAFTRMPNLKLLKFYFSTSDYWRYDMRAASDDWMYNKWLTEMDKVKIIDEGLESLPDELRYVSWPGYPLKYLPLKPEHLVDLEMPYSKLQHLWKDTKFFGKKLGRIDLRRCRELTEVPDLYQATKLESMQLGWCSTLTKFPKISSDATLTLCLRETAIEEVPDSAIKCLSKIVKLDISSTRLRNLPSMLHLTSLEKLYLNGCSNITEFPEISGAITYLDLSETAIEEVPDSAIKSLSKIVQLEMGSNKMLRNLPSMLHLTSMKTLRLNGCANITEFPDIPEALTNLDLSGTGIEEVPSFIGRRTNLGYLTLDHCKRLTKFSNCNFQLKSVSGIHFPEVLENELLFGIVELSMRYCKNLESLPNILCCLDFLEKLDLCGCPGVEKMLENVLPFSTSVCLSLVSLDLSECNMEVLPIDALCPLYSLRYLNLSRNEFESLNLELFPLHLRTLDISYCKRLRRLQALPKCLEVLIASNCTSLETLPGTDFTGRYFNYYYNCLKLDERTRVKIQTYARKWTQFNTSVPSSVFDVKYPTTNEWVEEVCSASYCFPGSEIPEWIINQNQGSSIKIDLPPHWYSNKLVGFVVCFVASCDSQSSNHNDLTYVECECKIKDPDCDGQDITFNFPKTVIEHPKSDHVFIKSIMLDSVLVDLKSDQGSYILMTDGRFNTENSFSWEKACFRFSTSKEEEEDCHSESGSCCKVKKCGINLVYSESEDQVFETELEEEDCHSESEEDQVFETETESEEEDCHFEWEDQGAVYFSI